MDFLAPLKHKEDLTDDYKGILLNMLAVMHGDGGHYTNEHGLLKSVEDAMNKWYKLKVEVQVLREEDDLLPF